MQNCARKMGKCHVSETGLQFPMTFQAYCFKCEKKVQVATNLDGGELWQALDSGADIEVMHVSDNEGDHFWKLNHEEKEHLRGQRAKGFFRA